MNKNMKNENGDQRTRHGKGVPTLEIGFVVHVEKSRDQKKARRVLKMLAQRTLDLTPMRQAPTACIKDSCNTAAHDGGSSEG
jgi:hypothetical protein